MKMHFVVQILLMVTAINLTQTAAFECYECSHPWCKMFVGENTTIEEGSLNTRVPQQQISRHPSKNGRRVCSVVYQIKTTNHYNGETQKPINELNQLNAGYHYMELNPEGYTCTFSPIPERHTEEEDAVYEYCFCEKSLCNAVLPDCSVRQANHAKCPDAQQVKVKTHPTKIIGGEVAKPGELGYQISIRRNGNHTCSGALVKVEEKQAILTVAHCVLSGNSSDYTVIAGSINRTESTLHEQTRQVRKIIVHQNYSDSTFANDIAVLLIEPEFEINENVWPVPLPHFPRRKLRCPHSNCPTIDTYGLGQYSQLFVSGWGNNQTLQMAKIGPYDLLSCKDTYEQETIHNNTFCAVQYNGGRKVTCQGESGSPIRHAEGGFLAGLVSWSYNCDYLRYPSVNTEIFYFEDWIKSAVSGDKQA